MRWIGFVVVAAVVVTMQASLAPWLAIGHVRPDGCLVFVVFLGLRVRGGDAGIGAFFLGLAGDLMSIERIGLLAVSYMLIAFLVSMVKEFLFRQRLATFVLVTLVAGVILRLTWLLYRHVLYDPGERLATALINDVLGGAIYSALLAILTFGVLVRMAPVFWQEIPRYAQATRNRLV